MSLASPPEQLRQQIGETLIAAIGEQAERLAGRQIADEIRRHFAQVTLSRAINEAIGRGVARFQQEYLDVDEDLTQAILESPDLWSNQQVEQVVLALIANPGTEEPHERTSNTAQFDTIFPNRRNRKRVDSAVAHLLHVVVEEVWALPGAREICHLGMLQVQHHTIGETRQQVELLRSSLRATTGFSPELHQVLLRLIGAVELSLLVAPASLPVPVRPPAGRLRPWHNLPPRDYERFVGRQKELETLNQLLLPRSRHFLVTLDGIGGVGKSALAIELAYRYRESYAALPAAECFDAIVWVSAKRTLLTAGGIRQRQQTFTTLADLYREIATVLEQPAILQAGADQRRGLVERALAAQRTLLIIDNLETIDDEELLTFLRELPDPTKAIVTTRHRIDVAHPVRLTGMPHEDALALIDQETERKEVSLTIEEREELWQRTGGVPLAIVWSIGLMGLGSSVESVLRRLGSGQSDIARFAFAESVAGIRGRDAYMLLLALALFERNVNRQMLGQVAGLTDDMIGRDDGLAELLQLSLIERQSDHFRLLPLTRSYLLEELAAQPELERHLRERWIFYLTDLARPYTDPDWRWRDLRRLRNEGQHLITLTDWAQHGARIDLFLAVLPALLAYYDMVGQWADLLDIGRVGLDFARVIDDTVSRFQIESMTAWILSQQGEYDEAEQIASDALAAAEKRGDAAWQIALLQIYSQILRRRGAFENAVRLCEQGFPLIPLLPEDQRAYVNANLEYEIGKIARDQQDWATARRRFLAARAVFNEDTSDPAFNPEWAWGLLSNLGLVAHNTGDLDAAAELYQKALSFLRDDGSVGNIATILTRLASLEVERGHREAALGYAHEALERSRRLGMVLEQSQAQAIFRRLEQADHMAVEWASYIAAAAHIHNQPPAITLLIAQRVAQITQLQLSHRLPGETAHPVFLLDL